MSILEQERAALASAASNLLSSHAFQEAMAIVDASLSAKWKTAGDAEARERVFHEYDGLRRIIAQLRALEGEWTMHVEATKED